MKLAAGLTGCLIGTILLAVAVGYGLYWIAKVLPK